MTSANWQGLEAELRAAVRGEVDFDVVSRGIYATDASIYQMQPLGVIAPRDAQDVREVIRIARNRQIPLLPRGGGTSLSGQTVTAGVVLDFTRHMQQILEIDVQRHLVRVQPGVVLEQLNAALRPHGLQFGPDVSTSSRATLGGMIGNNSAGSRSVWYGKSLDHVRELQVLLSDGTELRCHPCRAEELERNRNLATREGELYRKLLGIIDREREEILRRYPRLLRRVSGYNLDAYLADFGKDLPVPHGLRPIQERFPDHRDWNLSHLLVGSEGTLGVVTEATLHVVPLPKQRGVCCLLFTSIDEAVAVVPRILGSRPSAVELLDRAIVEMSRENLHYRHFLDFVEGSPAALLIIEYAGDDEREISLQLDQLATELDGVSGLQQIVRPTSPEQREQIWRCREAGAPLLLSIPGARKPIAFVEDTAVSPDRLPEFTRRFRQILDRHQVQGTYYGHASVGCLHIRPLLNTKDVTDLQRLRAISDDVAELVLEFDGAMSGEHGDGLSRSYHNPSLFGDRLYHAFREVKQLFDPVGIMNPGKIVDGPDPTDHLRYGTDYHPLPVVTALNFDAEARQMGNPQHGFLAATEMCNGSGVCRKTHTGTMCPSFMGTGDEIHSPRGRSNALRLALSGQLDTDSLTSQRMFEVMELCLQCKGCKAECPSNVDVAKLKVEFLGQYYQRHRPPLGTVLMGHVAWLNRMGSALAPVSNWMMQIPGFRALLQWGLGIDQRRTLPRFVRQSFASWFENHRPISQAASRGTVVLLDDCLTSYCEPDINRSAVELLELAGYRVLRAGLWCCGRSMISKGLLPSAQQLIQSNLQKLDPFLQQGFPILGTEPSCLLTLVEEYPDLVPSPVAERLRKNAFLVDDWLYHQHQAQQVELKFQSSPKTGLLHGHCQQKALIGTVGTRGALQLVPDFQVREVDSGCCGMAGAFGYEHYDLSQRIGNRVLFPAVNAHKAGPVLASGVSCRHQIRESTSEVPLHPVQWLRQHWQD